jgi:hypothetical protein
VRLAREERERNKADAEEALTLLNRERAVAEAMESEAKEDEFHLEQLQVKGGWGVAGGGAVQAWGVGCGVCV